MFREIKVVPPLPAVLRLGDYAVEAKVVGVEPESAEEPPLFPPSTITLNTEAGDIPLERQPDGSLRGTLTDSPKAEPSPKPSEGSSRGSDGRSRRG